MLNNKSTASWLCREPIQKDLQVKINQARAIEIFQPDLPIIVIHNFPKIIDFFELVSQDDLITQIEQRIGIKGTLYQTDEYGNDHILITSLTSTEPMNLWPLYGYSSPLKYNARLDSLEIELYNHRPGELLYFLRFKYLLFQGLKLLRNKGFLLIYKQLSAIKDREIGTILKPDVVKYSDLYSKSFQYI